MSRLAVLVACSFIATLPATAAHSRQTVLLETVYRNRVDWDERVVEVRGWLRGCHGGMLCVLTEAPHEAGPENRPQLTLDYVVDVEPKLGALDGREVILRVRVTDECAGDNICVDRGPDVVPISVVRAISRKR